MPYRVDILQAAQKQLSRIPRQDQSRIVSAVRNLADDPRPDNCKKLTGRSAWRIRIGNYRVIYEIHDARLLILVVAIAHRKDIYRFYG